MGTKTGILKTSNTDSFFVRLTNEDIKHTLTDVSDSLCLYLAALPIPVSRLSRIPEVHNEHIQRNCDYKASTNGYKIRQ
jgi:hypothetical protein